MAKNRGRVTVPTSANIWPHELRCAKAITSAGNTVEFLARMEGYKVKTPDLVVDGVVWELKSPESSNLKSLQRILRRAGSQSRNVNIDTTRTTKLSDTTVEKELRRLPLTKSVRRIIMVAKDGSIIDIGRSGK